MLDTRVGELEVFYSTRGTATYIIEVWHDGLMKHRVIKGTDLSVVKRKVHLQVAEWDEKWSHISARDQDRRDKEGKKQLAAERTAEAQRELDRLQSILADTLKVNDVVDWEKLKDKSTFTESKPLRQKEHEPHMTGLPPEPRADSPKYQPKLGVLDRLIASRRTRISAECRERFQTDHARWEQEVQAIQASNALAQKKHEERLKESERKHEANVMAWESRRSAFLKQQKEANYAIDRQREAYMQGAPDAVSEYCDLVLSQSDYPSFCPKEFEVDYNPESKMLVVDYALPSPEAIPTLKEVKYVQSRDEFTEHHLSQAQVSKLYDDLLYQICLRTIHELFEADVIGAIESVVFNGVVTSVDRSSGQEVTSCVISVQARRGDFMAINLANVDPKACFKALKGVGSSKLYGLAAVPPIVTIQREDSRFVSAYEVANTLDESSNLAAMDWEDFEHLIREVFEKEFLSSGGDVKVTQASRDGGVDAVAFDPDPIRGGKIVIQAKRYTHTVGVSAVRDLYGTVLNEGANKGILVTTSDYGPDAYAFANGKPLVLLNGSNLLHMLEKHGHKARIDLQEARTLKNSTDH